ncbi:MAG: PEP-CTERM sorting domain-containing protein [Aquabacterium sp.]
MQHKQLGLRALTTGLIAAAAMVAATAAHATQGVWDVNVTPDNGFGGRTTSWTNASSGTLYAEWNWFTDDSASAGIQDFTPDVGSFGTSLAHVYETSGTAFITGGGNIYSFAAPTSFTSVLGDASGVAAGARTLALRISTIGNLPLPTATLNGVNAQAIEVYSGDSGSAFGGAEKEYLWLWTGVTPAANYTFQFNAAESSMSLDQVALYAGPAAVAAVPEPSSAALLLAGMAAVGCVLRRRRA